ncbi:MAG: hypothetical protein ABIW76_05680, partial [Fibrobacteria bacterium]
MLHLFRARIIQCTLLAMLAAIDGYAQSKDDSGHDTLKFYPDPQSRTPHPISGTFGAGLFHSNVPALTAPQVYSPAILNDSRGLDVNGNLPKGAESAPYRIRPMALAATLVTADLHEELLVLDGPSENGWSDSARFLVFGGAEGKGYFAPKATALPPGTYADMLRLLGKSLPSTIAFLKRMDSAYSLEIFPVGTLLCGSAECPAPAPIQSIPLVGVPTTVITGEFNLDRYPDIAVSIAGYPGRVQVLLGGPEGFSESSRKILTGIARFPIRNTGPQNRLGAARNIAVGLFPDTAGTTDSIPDLIIATCHPRIPDLGWRLEVFHNFAV